MLVKDLEKSLSNIEKNAAELNRLADGATAELTELEMRLVKAGVGIEVWDGVFREEETTYLDQAKDNEMPVFITYRTGFARLEKSWGLAIKKETKHHGGEHEDLGMLLSQEIFSLLKADRDLRIAAIGKIAELVGEIEKAIAEKTDLLIQTVLKK